MNVLIIDDEIEICLLLQHQLRKMGIVSQSANSIEEALDLFDPSIHEVVFLDINLPDGNGLSIIPQLKEKNAETKIIVSSAFTSGTDLSQVNMDEVYKILTKPFSKENVFQLFDTMDNQL